MSKKPAPKKKEEAETEEGTAKPRASRKMLLVAVALCMASLGGGFFLARMAYMQDAEAYEPEYKGEKGDKEMAAMDKDGKKKDGKEKDKKDKKGKEEKPKLRDDIADPLAKDGHEAEKAMALQAKDKDKKDKGDGKKGEEEVADSGLLDFGDMLTNIHSFNAQGQPKTAFLKVSLMVAYRPDEGSGKLMMERQPFMRDLFNGYLRGLTESDVRGMAGILYIKAELLKRARAAVGNDLPQEILISDLIVQ